MARTKSAYRKVKSENTPAEIKSEIPPVGEIPEPSIPEIKIDGERAEPIAAISVEAEPAAVAAAIDTASAALRRQIERMRQGEELQRQHAAQMVAQHAQPLTREQKLAAWKANGLTETEESFLRSNFELVDHDGLLAFAANEATKQGHERNTEAHMEATKRIFHEHLDRVNKEEAQEAKKTGRPPMQLNFRPSAPASRPRAEQDRVTYSAPVSRDVPSADRGRYENPGRITLSADEQAIAAASGISLRTYAEMKIRMQREKVSGQRQ